MKFTLIFGFLFIAFFCNESHCSAKRREKRTLGTILQFFGYRIVPISPQNQVKEPEAGNLQPSQINPMRIQTVMPTERVETTSIFPEAPTTSVVETFTPPSASTDSQFVPNFIPIKADMPLRIIVNDMNSASTETPAVSEIMSAVSETTPAMQGTPPRVAANQQFSLPLMLAESGTSAMPAVPPTPHAPPASLAVSPTEPATPQTASATPSVVSASPSMVPTETPIITSLSGSPLPQLMPSMPFRIIMTAPAATEASPYIIKAPSTTAPIDVRANLASSNSMERPSENIEALPLSFNLDQQFAPQMTSEKIQRNNKNIEVLRSDEVSSSFFGQQTFPPTFNIYPQFLMPPQSLSESHQEIDRSDDFSSSHTAMNFNGQYYDYLTYHR